MYIVMMMIGEGMITVFEIETVTVAGADVAGGNSGADACARRDDDDIQYY